MESLALTLSKFITDTSFDSLTSEIIEYAKERVLDIIASATAGACSWDFSDKLISSAASFGESGKFTIIGREERASFLNAAWINSCLAHSVELDDGHLNAGMHAGTVVIPTALAMSEKFEFSGKDLLMSIIIGYDVAYRLARSMSPALIQKGFHPSAVCGAIGAAAVAAKLMRLSGPETAHALSIAAIRAGGLMESTISGQSSKGIMVGQAATTGITSAFFAQNDFPGPDLAFEGKNGLLQTMSEDVSLDDITKDLACSFEITDTYVKLYPACRHAHTAIEGIALLKDEYGFSPDDIEKITVGTHPIAFDLTGHIHHPGDPQNARFSTTYCVASTLLAGSFRIADLEMELLKDPKRHALEDRVEVVIDDEVSRHFPAKRGSRITVRLNDGRVMDKFVYKLKGSPDIPVGWPELYDKFLGSASLCFTSDRQEEITSCVKQIDSRRASELASILSSDISAIHLRASER